MYDNCFYSCRYCNNSRGNTTVDSQDGDALLEPCSSAWSEHFAVDGDKLVPLADDRDADYTEVVYDLNDPRKVAFRRNRREELTDAFRIVREVPGRLSRLLEIINSSDEDAEQLIEVAEELRCHLRSADRQIRLFCAVPSDSPDDCVCGGPEARSLPAFLEEQVLEHPDTVPTGQATST